MTAIARERYDRPVHATARHLAIALALGLAFVWFAPFGSHPALDLPVRFTFWMVLIPLGYGLALAARRIISVQPDLARRPLAARLALMAVGSGLVNTLATAAAMHLAQPERSFDLAGLAFLLLAVIGVQLALSGLILAWPSPRTVPPSVPASEPAFLARIPPRLGRDLIAVGSEDHYVRVHTLGGSHLLLMTFAEALRELECQDGLQVHRCWWVARPRIETVNRRDGRTSLRLQNGLQVPVSRSHRAAVRSKL